MVTVKKGKKNPHFSLLKLQNKFVVFKPISKEEMQKNTSDHFQNYLICTTMIFGKIIYSM